MHIDQAGVQAIDRSLGAIVDLFKSMEASLERIEGFLARIDERTSSMSNEMNALKAAVERMETAEQSMVTLLNGIAQLIRDNAANPAVLQLLADQINRDADTMVAAVQANTDLEQPPSPATSPQPGSGASALNPFTPAPTPSNPRPESTPNSGVRPPAQDPRNPAVPLGTNQVAPGEPGSDEHPNAPVEIPPPDAA